MLASNVPVKVSVPFATSGTKNTIPVASQIGITPGAASYTDGFVPLNFTPKVSGGIPPFGADFNGILNAVTQGIRWACAGGSYAYDATYATAISGYPAGAQVQRTDGTGFWLNLTDGNSNDPEVGGAGWVPMENYGITPINGLTNANVTLTSLQYARPIITLAGTLTGNVQIIFPTTLQQWIVINNTTGAFTVTCKTASGTGSSISNLGSQIIFWGDGTNLNALSSAGRLINVQRIVSSGAYVPTAGTQYVIVEIVGAGGSGSGTAATSAGNYCAGAGGAGGGYCKSRLSIAAATGQTITIGAQGVGGTGIGATGGATTFGALMTAGGGSGGTLNAPSTSTSIIVSGGSTGGGATGGNIENAIGGAGGYGLYSTSSGNISGYGGSSHFSSGGAVTTNGAGGAALIGGSGAGGAGAAASPSQAAQLGGNGAQGQCIIWEYA